MAVDMAIHDAVEAGLSPPTLRFYRWDGPAVSIGRNQNAARSIDLEACRELGVPIVRRPTGGRGILHGGDQTVSMAVPYRGLGRSGSTVQEGYDLAHAGFVATFAALGIRLETGRERRSATGVGDCFALRTAADLVTTDGHKLIGSAQRRGRLALLVQATILHLPPTVDPRSVFLGPTECAVYPLQSVSPEELTDALACGFARSLQVELKLDTLSQWEVERAAAALAELKAARL